MKAISLPAYNKNVLRALLSLQLVDKPIPKPTDDEVFVKMHAASCNPSDIAFVQGGYNIIKTLPCVPGFEGSGQVIDAGKNATHLVGKRISCFIQENVDGTWSEYFLVHRDNLFVLKDGMDFDQAACLMVNPFTAFGLIDIALKRKSKGIVQNASGGQVAQFIRRLAAINNIQVIDIVRKKETAEMLVKQGCKYVLYEMAEDFDTKLSVLCAQLHADTAFDAVGGTLSGKIIHAMPSGSDLVVYGALSGKNISEIDYMDIIFKNKSISGFNLIKWKSEIGTNEYEKISNFLQDQFIAGKLHTTIQQTFSLNSVLEGLKKYIGNMSGGKVLFKP